MLTVQYNRILLTPTFLFWLIREKSRSIHRYWGSQSETCNYLLSSDLHKMFPVLRLREAPIFSMFSARALAGFLLQAAEPYLPVCAKNVRPSSVDVGIKKDPSSMPTATLSPRQAAHALGIRLDSLYALLWAGKLTAEKHNGRWRVCADSVNRRRAQRIASL
jgi:hypothetical protein